MFHALSRTDSRTNGAIPFAASKIPIPTFAAFACHWLHITCFLVQRICIPWSVASLAVSIRRNTTNTRRKYGNCCTSYILHLGSSLGFSLSKCSHVSCRKNLAHLWNGHQHMKNSPLMSFSNRLPECLQYLHKPVSFPFVGVFAPLGDTFLVAIIQSPWRSRIALSLTW